MAAAGSLSELIWARTQVESQLQPAACLLCMYWPMLNNIAPRSNNRADQQADKADSVDSIGKDYNGVQTRTPSVSN
eukprot:scaffold82680_cov20-Prasinocladus_malaysianus.AAC.1